MSDRLREALEDAYHALTLARAVILSGEGMTVSVEEAIDAALSALKNASERAAFADLRERVERAMNASAARCRAARTAGDEELATREAAEAGAFARVLAWLDGQVMFDGEDTRRRS